MSEMQDDYPLGLDLGTTFSCIGVYRNGGVEIIPNRKGERTTPSIVTIIDEGDILIGEDTLGHLVKDYDSSIYAIKRFIGRRYDDAKIEIEKENFPFKIDKDEKSNFPLVEVNKNGKKIKFTLEEISSFVIRKMVYSAENYLNKKVSNLVITVPANFNDAQRNCTKRAAELAGLKVLRIINEPTAAALAYGLEKSDSPDVDKEKKILVFDLGGGTFDVTILKIIKGREQNFKIISTNGDKFLGGEDFDNRLVEYVLDRFCQKMKESKEEIKKDKKSIKKLKISCENIKRILSSDTETTLYISNFFNGNDILEKITRKDFEDLNENLFQKLKEPIDEAMIDAKLRKDEISEIVLVGGSSRIPKIKTLLKDYFGKGTRINDSINPEEAVAYGATLMAAKILIKPDNNMAGFCLMDITPLSLGINVLNKSKDPEKIKEGHVMSVLIKRGSKIPFIFSKKYQTSADNQSNVVIDIFEGEKMYTKYNHLLGKLELFDIPKKKKGEVKIEVTFFIDVNGILSVTATEVSTVKSINTRIKNDTNALSDEDIKKIREKNQKLYEKTNANETHKEIDYSNIKEILKKFQDAYEETEDNEEKYDILKNYNEVLEEFINLFDTDFDNETMVEKYYIYVKELINSYIKMLNMKEQITRDDKDIILQKIKEYIKTFAKQRLGYLDNLIELMKSKNKKIFFEIVVKAIEELKNSGIECLKEKKNNFKYHSLLYFEKALSFFKKYIGDFRNMATCDRVIRLKCEAYVYLIDFYIRNINSDYKLIPFLVNQITPEKLCRIIESIKTSEEYMLRDMCINYKSKFKVIEMKYKDKGIFYFINYILELKPYPGLEEEIKEKGKDFFEKVSPKLIKHLKNKYDPRQNGGISNNDDKQPDFCVIWGYINFIDKIFNNVD